jgi:hypothetical protein
VLQRAALRCNVQASGLKEEQIVVQDETLRALIKGYCREAGVRHLKQEVPYRTDVAPHRHCHRLAAVPRVPTPASSAPRFAYHVGAAQVDKIFRKVALQVVRDHVERVSIGAADLVR